MYDQHIEIKSSKIGLGMFSKVQIPARVPIKEFKGNIYTLEEIWKPTDPPDAYSPYLQIGPNIYLGPAGSADGADFINHSCDPNCYIHIIGTRAILYSLYVIPAGAELTFDYSTTSTDTKDMWEMKCSCQSPKCRGSISGHQYLSDVLKNTYKTKGITPLYILEPNLFMKRIK